ncbi:MAG: hypothetical protein ACXV76_13975 [Halobacteriota archaeon]
MGKALRLAIVGAVFGIFGAVNAVLIQIFNESLANASGSLLYFFAAGAIISSAVGFAGGVLEKRKNLGAALMIIGALGVLNLEGMVFNLVFGVLTFMLFLVAGVLILRQNREKARAPPTTRQNAGDP